MKKALGVLGVIGVALFAVTPAWASIVRGCVDSPENPTTVLALLGGAVAGVPWLRGKIRERRQLRGR